MPENIAPPCVGMSLKYRGQFAVLGHFLWWWLPHSRRSQWNIPSEDQLFLPRKMGTFFCLTQLSHKSIVALAFKHFSLEIILMLGDFLPS